MLIFLHIQKTAGTTLRFLMDEHFPQSEILLLKLMTREHWDRFVKNSIPNVSQYKLLYGHMKFGIHDYFSEDCKYITMLRDPFARVVSHYRFLSAESKLPPGRATLKEYILWLSENNQDNHQTRVLAGSWVDNEILQPCSPEMLEKARKNLDDYFIFAGIQEKFQESIALLNITMGWKNKAFITRNTSANKKIDNPGESIDDDLKRLIIKTNKYDYEIYNHAKGIFEKLYQSKQAEVDKAVREMSAQITSTHGFKQRAYNLIELSSQILKTYTPRLRKIALLILGPFLGKLRKEPK